MCRRSESPTWPYPVFIFFYTPLLARLFPQYRPNEIPDKYKNKLIWQTYFFIFNRLKNNDSCFFNTYISNIRLKCNPKSKISNIKRSQNKNKHSKWKICWVKSIATTKSMLTPLPLRPNFTRKSWSSLSAIFQKKTL